MSSKLEQLDAHLQRGLNPVYLISGDEPLQSGEAADAVRLAAKQAGYDVREVIHIEQGNEWPLVNFVADSLSIFSDKKLIDLRLPSGKPGQDGSKTLIAYCQNPPPDTILLITAGKLDRNALKAQWFQAIDKLGIVVQVWPLQGGELLNWLQRRCEKKGLTLNHDALKDLALRVEGNLLAAAQEIEKLFILYGAQSIDLGKIEYGVADSARFDVFRLTDYLLAGRLNRAAKVLGGLKAEGVAAPIVLWALSRELRILFNAKNELESGTSVDSVCRKYQIRDKRKPTTLETLKRLRSKDLQRLIWYCAEIDRTIKGQLPGDCWEALFSLCVRICRPDLGLRHG